MNQEAYDYGFEPETQPRSRRPLFIAAGVLAVFLTACACVLCLAATYLVLSDVQGTATPTPPPAISIDQIVNIQWQWTELVESQPDSQSLVPDPERYVTVFRPDGQLPVKADCNVAQGAYRAEGNSLAVNMGPMTAAQCPPESLSVQFVDLLANADSFGMDGGLLVLGLRDAAGRMVFRNGGPAEAFPVAPAATATPTGAPAPQPTPTGGPDPQPTATGGPAPQPTATGGPAPQPTATGGPVPQPTPTPSGLLQAVILAPTEGSVGQAVAFDGSQSRPGSSPIAAYGWDFGDGGRAEGATVNHVYGLPGTYVVTLTVTDEAGSSNAATTQITIRGEGASNPEPTGEPEGGLVGPTWQWVELNQETRFEVPDPERYRLKLHADGSLDYVADCVSGSATYVVEEDALRIDLGTAQPVECGPSSLSKEYLELLGDVVVYELEGTRLSFYLTGGKHMAFLP